MAPTVRYLVVVVVGLALLTTGMFFPWGDKQVVRADCTSSFIQSEVRSSQTCDVTQIDGRYWSDHLTIDVRTWRAVDGETTTDVDWDREFRDYKADGDKVDGNGGLFWGRPVLWFGIGIGALALVAAVMARRQSDVWQQGAAWSVLGVATIIALGAMLGIGGMVIHAATWSGVTVQRLSPLPGALLVTAGGAMTIFGAIRFHQSETWRLQGLTASPLAPIHSWQTPQIDTPAKKKLKLRWDGATWTSIAAVTLFLMTLWVPFAHKDIVLVDCDMDAGRGWVCTDHDLTVAYHLGRAEITDHQDTGSNHFSRSFDGDFQSIYGGSSLLGIGPYAMALGTLALAVAGSQHLMRQEWPHTRPVLAAWAALAGAVIALGLAAVGIVHQSWTWAGSPAGHLRPGVGAWAGALGVAFAVAALWQARRSHNTT